MPDAGEVPLWPGGPSFPRGNTAIDRPQVTVHLPAEDTATGTGVIVAPGGGYRVLAADHEGLQVAHWLNRRGIAAFVLRYRLGERYSSAESLADGLRAMRLVRYRAAEFGVAKNRLGMLGFSAGGHLTVAVGTHWGRPSINARVALAGGPISPVEEDPVERESARPDFLVPIYAVTNGVVRGRKADEYTPTDTLVIAETPPTFLVHSHEDAIVPASQSTLFYNALLAAGVPAELHIYGFGEHGMGLGVGDADFRGWPALLHSWLRRSGLLTSKERCAVRGRVTVDGAVPGMAWVSFTPLDENSPPARSRTSRGEDGCFAIDADHGVVPGPHRVAVHHISEQFPFEKTGAYTLADAKAYDCGTIAVGTEPVCIDAKRPA